MIARKASSLLLTIIIGVVAIAIILRCMREFKKDWKKVDETIGHMTITEKVKQEAENKS